MVPVLPIISSRFELLTNSLANVPQLSIDSIKKNKIRKLSNIRAYDKKKKHRKLCQNKKRVFTHTTTVRGICVTPLHQVSILICCRGRGRRGSSLVKVYRPLSLSPALLVCTPLFSSFLLFFHRSALARAFPRYSAPLSRTLCGRVARERAKDLIYDTRSFSSLSGADPSARECEREGERETQKSARRLFKVTFDSRLVTRLNLRGAPLARSRQCDPLSSVCVCALLARREQKERVPYAKFIDLSKIRS